MLFIVYFSGIFQVRFWDRHSAPVPMQKWPIFSQKMVENSQSRTPKKFVIVHQKQRIYQLFYEDYNNEG